MQLKFISFLLFILAVSQIDAQSKNGIISANAYYQKILPGANMIGDDGNSVPPRVNIYRFIIMETNGNVAPNVLLAKYGTNVLPVIISLVTKQAAADLKSKNGKPLLMQISKKATCWKIEISDP